MNFLLSPFIDFLKENSYIIIFLFGINWFWGLYLNNKRVEAVLKWNREEGLKVGWIYGLEWGYIVTIEKINKCL